MSSPSALLLRGGSLVTQTPACASRRLPWCVASFIRHQPADVPDSSFGSQFEPGAPPMSPVTSYDAPTYRPTPGTSCDASWTCHHERRPHTTVCLLCRRDERVAAVAR